ncbi:V-type H+-transporting ATPase subunit a [Nematocida displodere]|uniref:V-type proton ATPase subunit a n=1 Tax=Nematocida displodere TaxID=1805483 RepID=A0A177EBI2_9MICR|nr:V-type H+-transporting ATPase subunit a [Nematocida displodere]
MFRSEDVSMVRVYISPDIVRNALEELGSRELLHLVPLSDKKRVKSAHRLEMERILARIDFLVQELKKQKLPLTRESAMLPPDLASSDTIKKEIDKHYYRVVQLAQIIKETAEKEKKLQEDVVVLQELQKVVEEGMPGAEFDLDIVSKVGLEYVSGVITKSQTHNLEKFLWKSLHGNLCFLPIDMASPTKAGFICFTHGERAIERIRNICTKIDARIVRYDNKKNAQKEDGSLLSISTNLSQVSKVHQINLEALSKERKVIAKELLTWRYYVIREIEIEGAKEKLEVNKENSYFTGQGFILKRNEDRFGRVIKKICEAHGDVAAEVVPIPEDAVRPTHFDTNKLTKCFQELTNVYGIPQYQEINPAVFTVTTFPFFFGAMFGDVGHGLIVLAVGMYLVRKEKVLSIPKSVEIIFEGRYLLVFMGLWSIYFGFLYSDFLGYPIGDMFSGYDAKGEHYRLCLFGIDSAWHHAKNGQMFINSLKMKMSIVIGFIHITLGMVLNGMNASFRSEKARLFGVVVPQMLIFLSLIGYMAFLIVLKWVTPSTNWPGIIAIVLEMISFTSPLPENQVFFAQGLIQKLLMAVFIASVPIMLLSVPIYHTVTKTIPPAMTNLDLWVHSLIEGVEFLMGLVSNISSYLRLWAVSLAHGELSSILFFKTIGAPGASMTFRLGSSIIWLLGTVLILVCLEGLSAVLHSLRLHWVEFGSKFFTGGGTLFAPLTFKPKILLDQERQPGQ